MSATAAVAAVYAARGWHVFPCAPRGKQPLGRLAPHGLKDATTDPERIARWWAAEPRANVAVATGASRLVVLDLDGPQGEESYGRMLSRLGSPGPPCLPDGASVRTPGGGWHLYFAAPYGEAAPVIGNSTSRVAPGIDVRAAGGYVLAPPSVHPSGGAYVWRDLPLTGAPEGRWSSETDHAWFAGLPTLAPAWWAAAGPAKRERRAPDGPLPAVRTNGTATPYGRAAMERELRAVLEAPEGTRNHTLNATAFCLGQLVAGGELPETPIRESLIEIGEAVGLEAGEVLATVESGLRAGMAEPRRAPERGAQW